MILINEKSYKKLFDELYNPLCNFAYRYINDEETAEDIVQEVFVYLWQKRKDLEIKSSLESYMFSSVKNKAIEKIRRLKLENKYIDETNPRHYIVDEPDFDSEIEQIKLKEKLYNSIEKLPDKCKIIFKKAKLDGMTYGEIADEMELSIKTIESQMRRAFILLREMLK